MVSTPSPPPAPDPVVTAAAQGQMNKETAVAQAELNMVDQYGPNGTLTYSSLGKGDDGVPRYSATQTLSPDQQKLYDLGNQTQQNLAHLGVDQSGKLNGLLAAPFDNSQAAIDARMAGMPALPVRTTQARQYTDATQFATDPTAPQARYAPDAILVNGQNIGSNNQLAGQLFAAGSQRLTPELAASREGAEAALANKGLTVGSTGYERGMRDVSQHENDAFNNLFLTGQDQAFNQAATRANTTFGQDLSRFGQFWNEGTQKSQQDFSQDMSRAAYTQGVNAQNFNQLLGANNANFAQDMQANDQNFAQQLQDAQLGMQQRTQALQEISAQRDVPINEISALMSGSQVTPQQYVQTPQEQVQPINYTGLVSDIYKGQMTGYQSQVAANNGMWSGIGSILGSGLGMMKLSDARAKTDIAPVGRLDNGLTVYSYRYREGGPVEIGLIAQDVAAAMPEAVGTLPSGLMAVDYAKATETI